jgi:hypothetical protein
MMEEVDSLTATLPLTAKGVVRLPVTIRERYLHPDAEGSEVVVQAAGTWLLIWIGSDRANVRVALPLDDFRAEKPYTRALYRWGVNIARWLEPSSDCPGVVTEATDGDERAVKAEITVIDEEVCTDV